MSFHWSHWRSRLAQLLLALWWGGFTFYTTAVVHVGTQVLHSATKQGFITQQVAHYLHALGGLALAAVLWELSARRKASQARRLDEIAWLVAVLALLAQVPVHFQMTALLDIPHREVLNEIRFYQFHRLYLCLATTQWLGSLLLLLGWPAATLPTPAQAPGG